MFKAIPSMFIDCASKCRRGSGYRLLRRMLRHAHDSRTQPLDNRTAQLFRYKGEAAICIAAPIPASMKKDVYEGETVITKSKLLAACCNCMSGGDKNDAKEKTSSLCVHGLPRAYLLSILLVEALVEHVLLKFFQGLHLQMSRVRFGARRSGNLCARVF